MISLKKLLAGDYDDKKAIVTDAEPPKPILLPVTITYKDWMQLLTSKNDDEKRQLLIEAIKREMNQ